MPSPMCRPAPLTKTGCMRFSSPYILPALAFAVFVVAGAAAFSSAPAPASSPPAQIPHVAAPIAAFEHSKVHLTDYTDNDGPSSTVIVSGAVGDYGTAVSVNPDGSVNNEHNSQLELRLSHGTFRLDIADLDKKFTHTAVAMNTATCSGIARVTDAVPIVAGSGTGAYKGIDGMFDLTITLDEVYAPTACSESNLYLAQMITTTGPGWVDLG